MQGSAMTASPIQSRAVAFAGALTETSHPPRGTTRRM
jgi:hypothetical protein